MEIGTISDCMISSIILGNTESRGHSFSCNSWIQIAHTVGTMLLQWNLYIQSMVQSCNLSRSQWACSRPLTAGQKRSPSKRKAIMTAAIRTAGIAMVGQEGPTIGHMSMTSICEPSMITILPAFHSICFCHRTESSFGTVHFTRTTMIHWSNLVMPSHTTYRRVLE